MNRLYITLFFNIVAGIVQTFTKSEPASVFPSHRSLPPAVWTTSWLLLAPHHRRRTFSQLTWIQDCGERPKFHLQSQWSSITHLLPVRSPFAFRNRTTERTSHLARLWIGAAISNTSHWNKAGSTTDKRARLTRKGSRSTAVLPQ